MFDFLRKKIKDVFTKVEKTVTKKITEKVLEQKNFDEIFYNLELALLENSVSSEVVDKVKKQLQEELVGKSVKRDFKKVILNTLKKAFDSVLFEVTEKEFLNKVKSKKPYVILMIGVNGSGKTTSIAKLTNFFKKNKLSCVLAAGDTFRAASIEQIKVHADKLKVKVITGEYGCDAASVAYDTIKYAEKNKIDIVLIDTAGRLHSNTNLMSELSKMKRVSKPDLTIFVADSLTGNDVVEQAKIFDEKIGIDYSILTKADVDNKGGAILSIGFTLKKPILFLGTGQEYKDLKHFNKEDVLKKLF